ncbi:DUF4298 domain-containing protein [uncultured Varibaculum sp.]|uniref:DUF4298 domain-containing protein n=1 Tax=uncultured Varibaculum sp. TaxID=413896 RepID=UPI002592E136|nr:DUF4298 domain-containing protein [uncultured Varibaculum sp.]
MDKAEVSASTVKRVSQMEAALVRLNHAIATVEGALDTYEQMWDDYRALDSYYSGKAWWEDLEADNQGLLPEDLPRGVLSEDALYDALGDAEALRQRLKELAQTER